MAVIKVPTGATLRLVLQTGVDGGGNAILRNKSFSNVKTAAPDQNIFDVAQALANLQQFTLNGISRVDTADIISA